MANSKNINKTLLFLALTFILNYLLVIGYLVLGGKWILPGSLIISTIYMLIPMLVTIGVQKLIYKEPLKQTLGISFKFNWWFLIAWFLPAILAFVTLGISLLFPTVDYTPDLTGLFERLKSDLTPPQIQQAKSLIATLPIHPIWLSLIQSLLAGGTINAVFAFGEELGWRGFLQKELSFMGFWKSSVIIGLVWGIWHVPIILQGHNYPEHPLVGVLMMTIFTLLLSPIFSYIRLKSKSVIAVAIFHGTLNASAGLAILVIKGGNDLTVGITGLAGFLAILGLNLVLFSYEYFLAKEPILQR